MSGRAVLIVSSVTLLMFVITRRESADRAQKSLFIGLVTVLYLLMLVMLIQSANCTTPNPC